MPNEAKTEAGENDRPTVQPNGEDGVDGGARANIEALKSHYRSGTSDLATDFFVPCLASCITYKRAVGYFSSSALITWAAVLPKLVENENIDIQLLASPTLSDQDRRTLGQVTTPADRDSLLQRLSDRIVLDALSFAESPEDVTLRLKLFAWLVAAERLEIRFAFPEHVDQPGLFHEKIGLFTFPWGCTVAFTGSANETSYGHSRNYESIDVFRDWVREDANRVHVKAAQFAEVWDGHGEGLRVMSLSPQTLDFIKNFTPAQRPQLPENDEPDPQPADPNSWKWRHQDDAIAAFLEAEKGVLEMATGTGKTHTTLRICKELARKENIDTIIITTHGTDLLNQWYKQLLELSSQLGKKFAIVRHYNEYHERDRFVLDPVQKILLISRLALPAALKAVSPIQGARTLLVHDEVHRLGSPGNRKTLLGLSDKIRFRLGLSATPEREYDQDGNKFVESHIGPVIFQFGLADAIKRGILSPFNYHPLTYIPDDNDKQRIKKVHARAAARKAEGQPMSKEEVWIELAKVYKTSRAKLPVFEDFLRDNDGLLARCLVFVETREYGEEVLDIVHRYRHDFHTYYAADESDTLLKFAHGDLECLITCHRLSEGIDIQSLRNVILFSSAHAKLETIQRMGRCLRSDPANPHKRANVVDFVRVAGAGNHPTTDEGRRDWLLELSKVEQEEVTT